MRGMLRFAILAAALAVAACNTVEGAGRDAEAVTHAVVHTVRDATH